MSNVIVGDNLIAAATGGALLLKSLAKTTVGTDKLLSSPASILANYIIEVLEKMSTSTGGGDWPLYVSLMPDGVNVKTNCGCVYDTAGLKSTRQMNGYAAQYFGLQLRIRSASHEVGWAKIEDVAAALDEVNNVSMEMGEYEYEIQNLRRMSPIIPLGIEPGTKRRYLFTINYLMTVKELTSA